MNLKAVECCLDHLVFQNIYNFGLLVDVLKISFAMCAPTVQCLFLIWPTACESVLPRVSKVLHLCFHCIFLVLKVVTNIEIGPGTA